jgi:hypothetical protein
VKQIDAAPKERSQSPRSAQNKGRLMGYRYHLRGVARWSGVGLLVLLTGGCARPRTVTASDATPGQTPTGAETRSSTAPTPNRVRASTSAPPKAAVKPRPIQAQTSSGITVTQANIAATICASEWTAIVRPDPLVPTELKEQLASGSAYMGDTAIGDHEEDPLIPLGIGGVLTLKPTYDPNPTKVPKKPGQRSR